MNIRLFGIAKEIVGGRNLSLTDTGNITTVGDLKQWLSQQYPALHKLQSYAVAVDNEYANEARVIQENSEVAVLPPVSGG